MSKLLFSVAVLWVSAVQSYGADSKPLFLKDALSKGFITADVKGLGDHLGQCIEISVTSIYKKEIQIAIDAGLKLIPEDTSVQNMIVTQEKILVLSPHAIKKVKLFAMCTEQSDRGPSTDDLFALGATAEGSLLEVVQFISTKKYQTSAAQHAIWCITDSSNLGGIYDETNPALAKELRILVAKLTGKIPPWYQIEYAKEPGIVFSNEPARIHADFKYTLKEDGLVTFGIYNERGDTIQTILKDHPEKAGMSMMKIRFESRNLPKGKYFARVTNNGILIEEKIFEL